MLLTKREMEIFELLIKNNYSTDEIAQIIGVSPRTVRNHISNVIGKLGVTSRTQAIITLMKNGIINV